MLRIDLSSNQLQGFIPSSLGRLSSLSYLNLSNNHLNGNIPASISGLGSLTYLDLSSNQLQGFIPSSLGRLSSLSYLNLSSNHLNDTIPASISYLGSHIYLDLSSNNLSGDIPCKLGYWNIPAYLNFSYNNLSGSIPEYLSIFGFKAFQGNPNLRTDKFQNVCKVESSLPVEGQAGGDNDFYEMDILSSIGSLVNLVYLNLSYSGLDGNIPYQLGNLTSLTSLDLSHNYGLFATSLNWLSRLALLRDINLGDTDLSNAIDWSEIIGSLPLLEVLKMDDCQLSTPPSTSSFLHSANLRIISLSGNDFSSSLSLEWLFNTSNYSSLKRSLQYLDLSNNVFQGPIPDAIGNLEFLTYLDLSWNLLSRTLPDAIRNLEFLTHLDLSKNTLSSTIPNAIGNLKFLTYLALSENSLSSTIPDAIGNLEFLTYLDLSWNSLSSTIPDAIANLQSLTHMDLSYNSLSGPLPSTLGSFGALGGASSIAHLDLSNNHLKGVIPSSIANLEYLGYLDLSRNNLSGDIPCKLEIRKPPYFGDFSYNNLSGSIPKHMSYLGPTSFLGNPKFRTDKIQGRCDEINLGLYISIGLGFYTGFWAFCGTLTAKNSWRHAYFRFVDHILDNIYVTVAVNLARLRRNARV